MPNLLTFLGEPLNFKNKFKIYPVKVRDVVTNDKFGIYRHIFTINADDIKDQLRKTDGEEVKIPSPFEFLLINCYHDKNFEKLAKEAFEFFTHETFTILYERKLIIIGDIEKVVQKIDRVEDLVLLTEDEYFDFQNMIRESLGEKPQKPPELENPNENPQIRRIKELARERDRIKAK